MPDTVLDSAHRTDATDSSSRTAAPHSSSHTAAPDSSTRTTAQELPPRAAVAASSRAAILVGGWSFLLAAVGFIAVFSYLAAKFNYPTVLDGTASQVLPKLLALGNTGRAVWILYALIPLLLIPASIGTQAALGATAPNAMRAATILGTITAVCMFLGLARWPSVHWELAIAYATAAPDVQQSIDAIFRGLNAYLGNFIGEFLGELMLNGFFLLSAFGLLRAGYTRLGGTGLVVGVIGLIAAARNATPAVAMVAEVNNYVLPIWLVVLGVFCTRLRRTG